VRNTQAGFIEQRICAQVECASQFSARINDTQKHCKKCRKQHDATSYTPRYNGIHTHNENPDADD
jgi:ribosomal protein L37AE/L43A